MKNIVLFFLFLIGLELNGQMNYFTEPLEEDIPFNPDTLPTGTQFVDQWGYPWVPVYFPSSNSSSPPAGAPASAPTPTNTPGLFSCGKFKLYFADVISTIKPYIGYADTVDITNTLSLNHPLRAGGLSVTKGELRRWTVCQVCAYIENTIDIPNGIEPDIYFYPSETDGGGPIAGGSALFQAASGPGFVGGALYEHIVNPKLIPNFDPTPAAGYFDAVMKIDFGKPFNLDAFSAPSNLDLFSVLLHEITHCLGFMSLMNSNGIGFFNPVRYSLLDRYMINGSNLKLIDSSTLTFTQSTSDLISNKIKYRKTHPPFNSKDISIFSPITFYPGSSLGHIDDGRDFDNYLMSPGPSHMRFWSKSELEILCNMGYNLKSPSGGSKCNERYAIAVDDTANCPLGGAINNIQVTLNDYDLDGDSISLDKNSVILWSNAGTFTVSGNKISFKSNGTYCGTVLIRYQPISNNILGSSGILRIKVPCPNFCYDDPCNLVCNGGFENGLTLTQFKSLVGSNKYSIQETAPGWEGTGLSYFRGDNTALSSLYAKYGDLTGVNSLWGVPINLNARTSPGLETPTSNNNRYASFIQGQLGGNPLSNGAYPSDNIFKKLAIKLELGKTYNLSYKASAISWCTPDFPYSAGNAEMIVGFSQNSPNLSTPSVIDSFHKPISVFNSYDSTVKWTNVFYQFTATDSSKYINFSAISNTPIQGSGHPQYCDLPRIFIDDIRLVKAGKNISASVIPSNPNPKIGDTIEFEIKLCNVGDSVASNVTITSSLPSELTFFSSFGYSNYPNCMFASIMPNQCKVLRLKAIVNNNVINNNSFNTDLQCCLSISSSNNCIQSGICGSINVKGTDLVVSQILDYCNVFTVLISNNGPSDAHNAKFDFTPANCFGYLSYLKESGANAFYDISSHELTIPELKVGESSRVAFIGGGIVSSACLSTVSYKNSDETDLNISNNSVSDTIRGVGNIAGADTAINCNASAQLRCSLNNFSYNWTSLPAGTTGNNQSITVNPKVTTTYFIDATGNGCAYKGVKKVSINPMSVNLSLLCSLNLVKIIANVSPTGNYIYHWPNGASGVDSTLYPALSGKYFVTVVNSSGCSVINSIEVSNTNFFTGLPSSLNISCNSEVLKTIPQTIGSFTYKWYKNGIIIPNETKTYLNIDQAGNYKVEISGSGCIRSSTCVVTKQSDINATLNAIYDSACSKYANIIMNVSGGTPSYFYHWNNGSNSKNLIQVEGGQYICTVSDLNGCTAVFSKQVTNVSPTININTSGLNCNLSTGTLSADVTNGKHPLTYIWNTNSTLSYILDQPFGDYYCIVSDSNGCKDTAYKSIHEPLNVHLYYAYTGDFKKADVYTRLNGRLGNYNYTWSYNDTIIPNYNWMSHSNGNMGQYRVTVADASNPLIFEVASLIIDTPPGVSFGTGSVAGASHVSISSFPIQRPITENAVIQINGNYFIDDHIIFKNCRFIMEQGSSIIVETGKHLSFENCHLQARDSMWKGIVLNDAIELNMNNTIIQDALYALEIDGEIHHLDIHDNLFVNNYLGIYILPYTRTLNFHLFIGNQFLFNGFRKAYIGMSPSSNQIPFEQYGKPYAGIDVGHIDNFSIGSNLYCSMPNHFDNLYNGIVSNRTSLKIQNSEFKNILTNEWLGYLPPKGNAIYLRSPSNNQLKIQGNGINSPAMFENCRYGVWADGGDLSITGVYMKSMFQGVNYFGWNDMSNILINNNRIEAGYMGIEVNNLLPANHVDILYNRVNLFPTWGLDIQPLNSMNYPTLNFGIHVSSILNNPFVHVSRDTVYSFGKTFAGIDLIGCDNATVNANTIHLDSSRNSWNGINFSDCENLECNKNIITGTSAFDSLLNKANYPVALHYNFSHGTYQCNEVSLINTGVRFEGDNLNTQLRITRFDNHHTGLLVDKSALLDQHPHAANYWESGGSFNAKAINLDTNSKLLGVFTFQNTPSVFDPNGGNTTPNWFQQDVNLPDDDNCSLVSNNIGGGSNNNPFGEFTNLERLIMMDSVHYDRYNSELVWQNQRSIYAELKAKETSLDNSSLEYSFLINHQNDNIGQFYQVEHELKQILTPSTSYIEIINQWKEQEQGILNQIDLLKDSWTNADSSSKITIDQDLFALTESIISVHSQMINYQSNYKSIMRNELIRILDINSSINCTQSFQLRLKQVNDIFIREYATDSPYISGSSQTIIREIANLCPLINGEAVYKARAMRKKFEYAEYLTTTCAENYIGEVSYKTSNKNDEKALIIPNEIKVSIFPNPSKDFIILNFDVTPKDKMGIILPIQIELYDFLGQNLISKEVFLEGNQYKLSTSAIASGSYTVRVRNSSTELFKSKLIKID